MKLWVLFSLLSLTAEVFATGFIHFKVTCTGPDNEGSEVRYDITRYSTSPPGGPVTQHFTVEKTQGKETEPSVELIKMLDQQFTPQVIEKTFLYTQILFSRKPAGSLNKDIARKPIGYIHAYAPPEGKGDPVLDVFISDNSVSAVNTNGALKLRCRLVKSSWGQP